MFPPAIDTSASASFAPSRALYIKLGSSGRWEQSCLHEDQTVRLGYENIPTDMALRAVHSGDWTPVEAQLLATGTKTIGAARRHVTQIRAFFEADESVLWFTFSQYRLWWCFSATTIRSTVDGHSRPVIGKWSDSTLLGEPLVLSALSGRLTATQGFRGTICPINRDNFLYLSNRIQGVRPAQAVATQAALDTLTVETTTLIEMLTWPDFEIFTDLLFRAAGLRRESELGGTMPDLDLDLASPVTGDRYAVQVKATAGTDELAHFTAVCEGLTSHHRGYLVVHTPDPALETLSASPRVEVLGPQRLANLAVANGLVDWLIQRAG